LIIVLSALILIYVKVKSPKTEAVIKKQSEKTTELKIKDKKIHVEIADTEEKRVLG